MNAAETTYQATIYIGGDLQRIREVCQHFLLQQHCLCLHHTDRVHLFRRDGNRSRHRPYQLPSVSDRC